jgi:hypothetical protein
VSGYGIRFRDIKREEHPWNRWNRDSNPEVNCNKIHSISPGLAYLDTLMSIGIHSLEHKCIGCLLIFIWRCKAKLVPVPTEVNVSLR